MTARFLALLPALTDVNGDAQNALVLAVRAGWAGADARVESFDGGGPVPERPAAVVLGSSTDSALPDVLAGLAGIRGALERWLDDGVPRRAVGAGVEVLGASIETPDGVLPGLGILPGSSRPAPERVAGDLVVRTAEGTLVGYENHTRSLRLDAGARPFGAVVRGTGDGAGTDGIRHGSVLGTRLHGPVLAKNPGLADALLSRALGRDVRPAGEEAAAADAAAARIRAALLG